MLDTKLYGKEAIDKRFRILSSKRLLNKSRLFWGVAEDCDQHDGMINKFEYDPSAPLPSQSRLGPAKRLHSPTWRLCAPSAL